MVFVRHASCGSLQPLVVGPWRTAGVASWGEGAEILWIKFNWHLYAPYAHKGFPGWGDNSAGRGEFNRSG